MSQTEEDTAAEGLALNGFEGLTAGHALLLKKQDILTQDDLAELSVDELIEIIDIPEENAGNVIIAARKPWFSDTHNEGE